MYRILMVLTLIGILAGGVWADIAPAGATPGGGSVVIPAAGGADPTYWFTFSDTLGDVATAVLNAQPSGQTDDGMLVTSGTLYVTASADNNSAVGTYSLYAEGPAQTVTGVFAYDDLIYPLDDAASGINQTTSLGGYYTSIANPSLLTTGGLLFTSGNTEVNIYGLGNNAYAFYTATSGSFDINGTTGPGTAAVPEPGAPLFLSMMGTLVLGFAGVLRRHLR